MSPTAANNNKIAMQNTAEVEIISKHHVKLIEKCIRDALGTTDISNVNISIECINKVGENFVTDVFRITAEIPTPSEHSGSDPNRKYFFMKMVKPFISKNEADSESKVLEICKNEVYAYTHVFEEFSKMEQKYGIEKPDERILHAHFVNYIEDEETGTEYFILNDLVKEGYRAGDRTGRLDMNHMKIVLNELAKVHAASFAMKALERDIYLRLTRDMGENLLTFDMLTPFMKVQIAKVESLVKNESLRSKFNQIAGNIFELRDALTKKAVVEPYEAIGHGDLWTSNIMFQYDKEGWPQRAMMVDWQFVRCHSPVLDIFHLLMTSFSEDNMTVINFKYLLDFYYENLGSALDRYALHVEELYPDKVFRRQLKEFAPLGLYIGLMMLTYHMRTADDMCMPREVMARAERSAEMSPESERRFGDMWNFVLECFDECGLLDLQ